MTKAKTPRRKPPIRRVIVLPTADLLAGLSNRIEALDTALRDALARKPNQGLQDLVDSVKQCAYQLKAQRAELDQLAIQLEASTTAVNRLLGVVPQLPRSPLSHAAPLKTV